MNKQQINRTVGRIVIVLSFTALLAVLSGYAQPPQRDEGTAAHIFQLSIVGLVPMWTVFLMTADWKQPWRSLRALALSSAALVVAFGALYYLEHHRTKSGTNVGLRLVYGVECYFAQTARPENLASPASKSLLHFQHRPRKGSTHVFEIGF